MKLTTLILTAALCAAFLGGCERRNPRRVWSTSRPSSRAALSTCGSVSVMRCTITTASELKNLTLAQCEKEPVYENRNSYWTAV
jgi:hypothetical protein